MNAFITFLIGFLFITYGIVYLVWFCLPKFAREMIVFAVKAKIASLFTWKVKKDADTNKV